MSLTDIVENYQSSFVPPDGYPRGVITNRDGTAFASRYFPVEPKERRMWLKYNFIKALGLKMGRTEARYVATEEELKQVQLKQAQLVQAGMDQLVYSLYDPPTDPGMGWVFAMNFPEQRQRMIDLLNLKHDILEQLMILKTKSFPDQNDALLLFFISTLRPVDRQRFLTWLVGNDRSPEVLKSIVGPVPHDFAPSPSMVNGLIVNYAGQDKNNFLRDDSGNYPSGVVPNGLWKKMTNHENVDNLMLEAGLIYPQATNRQDMRQLFSQLPMRAKNSYSLPTPYTAHVVADQVQGRELSLTPVQRGGIEDVNWANYFSSTGNVDRSLNNILSSLFK